VERIHLAHRAASEFVASQHPVRAVLSDVPYHERQTERFRSALEPLYLVERELGVGGHAIVYLAIDRKHDRQVAVKVLRAELRGTDGAARFNQEIRVAARLTHPHIVPVLDSGSVGDSPYYVMPYVEGESLRVRLERARTIPLAEAIQLATEVADALDYAHAAGFVHRDIKPENILLLGGHAMVADFGIARALSHITGGDVHRTAAGFILGTPAYMSPEQSAGDDIVDGRSDIYSLATVLYEMIGGSLPFAAKNTQALIARRFVEAAPRLIWNVPDLPTHVDEAIAAALAMALEGRPATANAFARLLVADDTTPATSTPPATTRTMTPATAAVAAMPSVVVLPFANLSGDRENDFLSDGITEEIISTLSRMRTIRVAARTSSFAFKGKQVDVRTIAEQLGVTNVLDGSVRRSGSRVRVTAQLVDAITGFQLWSDRIERSFDDAFQIQDDIANAMADALSATMLQSTRTGTREVIDGAAHEFFLRGRFALNKRTEADLRSASKFFVEAVERQPEFALAWAGLADAHLVLGVYGAEPPNDVMPIAREAAERALAIDPSLGEAHATLGTARAVFDWDWDRAEDSFRRAASLSPRDPTVWQRRAMNVLLPRGKFDEARSAIDRARVLDPLSMVIATSVGAIYQLSGDAAGAVRALKRALDIDAGFVMSHYFLGGALRETGDLTGSAEAYRTAIARSGGTPEMKAGLAQTLAQQGERDEARALLVELTSAAATRHVSSCLIAQVHAALGDTEAALDALDRAAVEHDAELVFIGVRPVYAVLKGQARFDALRMQVGV
jgi:TolB-like protein/Flp pilus assembly protein TadD